AQRRHRRLASCSENAPSRRVTAARRASEEHPFALPFQCTPRAGVLLNLRQKPIQFAVEQRPCCFIVVMSLQGKEPFGLLGGGQQRFHHGIGNKLIRCAMSDKAGAAAAGYLVQGLKAIADKTPSR